MQEEIAQKNRAEEARRKEEERIILEKRKEEQEAASRFKQQKQLNAYGAQDGNPFARSSTIYASAIKKSAFSDF